MQWCPECECYVFNTIPSVANVIADKSLANRVAITYAHPAARHYEHLYSELTAAEQAEVDRLAPAKQWR